jgi:hypothetical protein
MVVNTQYNTQNKGVVVVMSGKMIRFIVITAIIFSFAGLIVGEQTIESKPKVVVNQNSKTENKQTVVDKNGGVLLENIKVNEKINLDQILNISTTNKSALRLRYLGKEHSTYNVLFRFSVVSLGKTNIITVERDTIINLNKSNFKIKIRQRKLDQINMEIKRIEE